MRWITQSFCPLDLSSTEKFRQNGIIRINSMISWLQGDKVDIWQQGLKQGIVLGCSGVGYEIQLLPRHFSHLGSIEKLTLWIHQVHREDGYNLFGFTKKLERDLFRTLISVNGVGPQIGIALLEEFEVGIFIESIMNKDIKKLSKAQGVGNRIAERLTVELQNKLSSFANQSTLISLQKVKKVKSIDHQSSKLTDLTITLQGLGYEKLEIEEALLAVSSLNSSKSTITRRKEANHEEDSAELLKASLLWLSKEAA